MLQRIQQAVPGSLQQQPAARRQLPQPQLPQPPPQPQGELNGGYDAVLFGPTDRPHEPLTAGMPFGAGPSFVPRPTEDDRTFLMRVAGELLASPSATNSAKALAERITLGQ
jgi:hypothetical protein